ncbi:MAG: hypothetical protein OXT74_08310 [Candidatus Poribacteria bacterium]|nr:hypothetical protein [Candidatus Poribacteria bacterium]
MNEKRACPLMVGKRLRLSVIECEALSRNWYPITSYEPRESESTIYTTTQAKSQTDSEPY